MRATGSITHRSLAASTYLKRERQQDASACRRRAAYNPVACTMPSGGAASKRLVALLTYVGKDIPEMCTLFFRFYTGYHGLARRDIYVVQSGSSASLDACLRRHRPTILQSDSSEQPFRERTKLTWLQESQHALLQRYVYVLIADLDEFFLPDPVGSRL